MVLLLLPLIFALSLSLALFFLFSSSLHLCAQDLPLIHYLKIQFLSSSPRFHNSLYFSPHFSLRITPPPTVVLSNFH